MFDAWCDAAIPHPAFSYTTLNTLTVEGAGGRHVDVQRVTVIYSVHVNPVPIYHLSSARCLD
jgi:hypothetical protein